MISLSNARGRPLPLLIRPKSLLKTFTRIVVFLVLVFFLLEAISSALWLGRLQIDRLEGSTEASHIEDFVAYYSAGQLILDGRGSELYEVEAISEVERETMGRPVGGSGVLPYFNPPFVALAMAPLSLLDIEVFSTILLLLVGGMVLLGGLATAAYSGLRSRKELFFFWIAYLSFYPIIWVTAEQQLSMFLFLGILGFAWFQIRGRPKASGFLLALVLVKPQMALLLFLVLVWKRQTSALAAFSAAALLLAGCSILTGGPGVVIDYPAFLLESTSWEGQGVNASRMFGWNSLIGVWTGDHSPSPVAVAALVVPTLAIVAFILRGPWDPTKVEFHLKLAMVVLASLLMNPHLYLQDLVLLVVVLGLLAGYCHGAGFSSGLLAGPAIGLWLCTHYGPQLVAEHSVPAVPIAMGILLAGFALIILKREHPKVIVPPPLSASLDPVAYPIRIQESA